MNRFYIWSKKRDKYWLPGGYGYTSVLSEAGIFGADEAEKICAQSALDPNPNNHCVMVQVAEINWEDDELYI